MFAKISTYPNISSKNPHQQKEANLTRVQAFQIPENNSTKE